MKAEPTSDRAMSSSDTPSPRRTGWRLVDGLILVISGAGIAITATQVPQALHWSGAELIAAVGLALGTLIAELFPLHLRHTTETETFSVTDVVWTAGLLLAPASVLLSAVAMGVLLSQAIRRLPLRKLAFNVGQFVTAMWVAVTVFASIPHSGPLHPTTWAVAMVAMGFNFVVNEGLVALVISLMEHTPVGSILIDSLRPDIMYAVGNIAIGIMGAVMWDLTPGGIVIVAVPMLLSYMAYAGWLHGMRERDRMGDLYQAGQVLLERLETEGDFRPFLKLVARMMDATAAEIVIIRDGCVLVHDASGIASLNLAPHDLTEISKGRFHRARSDTTVHTATIGPPSDETGSLAVFRRTALSPAERSLLEALAAQVYVKLRHSAMFARSVTREQELARVISSSSDGIFVIGSDDRIRSWNPAMERVTGVSLEAASGRPLWDVLTTPPGANDVWRSFANPMSFADGVQTGSFARNDGTIGWVRFSTSALRGQDGKVSGVVVVARDVSADIRAEQAKANFIAAISHELRTPLTPLKGYLSLLATGHMDPATEEAMESFGTMLRQADRLERLVSDLLDASHFEIEEPDVQAERVDLIELVGAVVAEARWESGSPVLFSPRCHRAPVIGDRVRVEQVLLNLVSNALKHSPPNSPVRIEVDTNGRMCVISVTDSGDGIPEAEQERIFERFYRVNNGPTRTTGGVGLGLYIAKQLVDSMAGRLWVRSTSGQGSTFCFSLPLLDGAEAPASAA